MITALARRPHVHVVQAPATPAHGPLIERSAELEALAGAVRRLAAGGGAVVVLEAPAGLGKTALLDRAAALAGDADCLVRRAAPGPLERHFPFGVVRALLEAPLREGEAQPLDGALAAAGELLLSGTVPAGDATMAVAHSVLWLCSALAERRPLALLVDDAQWADRASLEVLAYMARRIEDLPLLIVTGARVDDPDGPSDLLSLLGGVRSATVLQPQPLSPRGAAKLIRRLAPETRLAVCRDLHRAAGGNPWLLGELGRQLAVHGPEALLEPGRGTPPLTAMAHDAVRRRMAQLAPRDRAVVAALAVIGDGAPPHALAAVAGVTVGELGPARDALVAAGLLAAGGERFAHGLIAVAIAAGLARAERERLHREAARALMSDRADADLVAGHLLQCGPQADPEVSELLQRAAAAAAHCGAPHTAAAYLERALQERAPGDDRGRMLAQLATVAFDAGLPDSRQQLLEALHEARDRASRVDVLTRLAALNATGPGDSGLTALFERELAAESDPDARLAVEVAALDALILLPDRNAERVRRVNAIDLSKTTDPLLQRVVLAHRAWAASELGTPDARTSAALARQALDGDLLLPEAGRRSAYHLALRALLLTDNADEARQAIDALREDAVARGSLRLRAGVAWYGAELALRVGDVAGAEDQARLALSLVHQDVNVFTGGAINVLVCALAERGAFEEAQQVLRERRVDAELGRIRWRVRHARARLWLAEGDFERAGARRRFAAHHETGPLELLAEECAGQRVVVCDDESQRTAVRDGHATRSSAALGRGKQLRVQFSERSRKRATAAARSATASFLTSAAMWTRTALWESTSWRAISAVERPCASSSKTSHSRLVNRLASRPVGTSCRRRGSCVWKRSSTRVTSARWIGACPFRTPRSACGNRSRFIVLRR
jgi:hypothetical protein